MKMAMASERDLEMANDLAGMLDSFAKGYFPLPKGSEDDEAKEFDLDDPYDCIKAMDMLLEKFCEASLFRVTFGMMVMLDPRNEMVDPALSYLEHHPEAKHARESRDGLINALRGMLAIVGDSRGVDGYHMNGDVAEWEGFPEVDAAYTALAKESAYGLIRYLAVGAFA